MGALRLMGGKSGIYPLEFDLPVEVSNLLENFYPSRLDILDPA